jgi:hypothetical protein
VRVRTASHYARAVIVNDPHGPWVAAAYLVDDPTFQGTQHGMEDTGTLCGLTGEQVAIVRNPFWGTKPNDCPDCAERLQMLAINERGL